MLKIKKGLFIIGYGLSGGFGGIQNYEVIEAYSQDDADKQAWEMACETYESYVGMHGLRELSEIMEEDEIEDEDEAIIDATQEDIDFLDKRKEMYDNGYFDNLY
jgi:hypothetical protein